MRRTMGLWSLIVVKLVRPVVKVFLTWTFAMEFYGLENLPPEGPLIMTPNHVSYIDPILMGVAVRRRMFFMTWNRMFNIPGFGTLIRIFGAFPLKLEGHDHKAFKRAHRYLRDGQIVVVFPEGGRTTTGKLENFKPGAFRMALRLGIPVVPVTINGAYQVWPPHERFPRLNGKITIQYHPPIYLEGCSENEIRTRALELAHQARVTIAKTLDPTLLPEDLKELRSEI
jgi:1-acyl-sn-glycerol-3-phosphate acyltransferase